MSETCQKLAFTHSIVVLKSGLKNNWMKKLDRVNRPLWLLITKELIFGFQILDLKDHFLASLNSIPSPLNSFAPMSGSYGTQK